jgi:hypothetical protein
MLQGMLTNQQALDIIKQHEECYVVWATDRNAIVAVHPMPADANVEDRFKALAGMSTDYDGPTKGRFLSGATTTLDTLIEEANETERIETRVRIFNSWEHRSVDDLISIVRNVDFTAPMDAGHGSDHIVERLYKIHGPQLNETQISRLREFAFSSDADPEQESAQEAVQCYLAAIENDSDALFAFWRQHHSPDVDWSSWTPFTCAAGDTPARHQEIIDQLIKVVETPFMFGPRYDAMVALGKIGAQAGAHAVTVIKAAIHDSSEHVTEIRERVISRITTGAADWRSCPKCYRGYVNGRYYDMPSVQSCPDCLGLGYTQKAA